MGSSSEGHGVRGVVAGGEPGTRLDLDRTESPSTSSSLRRVAGPATLFLLATILPLLRQTGPPSWDTLWGEDGFEFYQDVIDTGPWEVLLNGYAGYSSFPIRILSMPMPWIPLERLALYCAVTAAVVCALLGAFVYRSTTQWIASRLVRLTLAALVVLMPAAGMENTGTVVNLIWTFATVVPWAFVSLEDRRGDVAARSGVAFLAATATPLCFIFAPLALTLAVIRRTRATIVVLVAFGVGCALQAFVMITSASELIIVPPDRPASDLVALVGARLYALYLIGPEAAVTLWEDHGLVVVVLSVLIVTALFLVLTLGVERRNRYIGATFFAYAFVCFFALIWTRGTISFHLFGSFDLTSQMRYSVPPTLMLASAIAVLVSPPGAFSHLPLSRLRRPLFVAHLVTLMVLSFTIHWYRSMDGRWSESVRDARAQCTEDPQLRTVEVAQDLNRYWVVRVPCDSLVPSA